MNVPLLQHATPRAVVVDASKPLCFHMNEFRSVDPNNLEDKRKVPAMVIHSFFKLGQEPTVSLCSQHTCSHTPLTASHT